MEEYSIEFKLKSNPLTSQESVFNTLVLLLKELRQNLDDRLNDYVINDILNKIQLQTESMKINIIDVEKSYYSEGVNK